MPNDTIERGIKKQQAEAADNYDVLHTKAMVPTVLPLS